MTDIIHYEHLYEQAEKLASQINKDISTGDVIDLISSTLGEYNSINISSLPNEVKSSLKRKHMGEIIFLLSVLSERDNINVYAALQDEIRISSLD